MALRSLHLGRESLAVSDVGKRPPYTWRGRGQLSVMLGRDHHIRGEGGASCQNSTEDMMGAFWHSKCIDEMNKWLGQRYVLLL